MYEKFFYLKEKPFHITPDPKFLFLSKKHREAIDLLNFGITGKKGFILLTGEVGTGKTTLSRALLEKLPKKVASALILNPIVSEHELLKTITADFGIAPASETVKAHLDGLNAFLLKKASEGTTAVVIIDEAQNLSPGTLEMVRMLSNLETEKEKLLQIVLVGQPELKDKLSLPELRQLNQRVIVRHHLDPLDTDETRAYIQNRLLVAGGGSAVRFEEETFGLIHLRSLGIPRMINIICDRALMAAFIAGKREVGIEPVKAAVDELEKEGYIQTNSQTAVTRPVLARYTPHIALSTFVIAFIAGVILGPFVLRLSGALGAP